jgi:hypothetical protein
MDKAERLTVNDAAAEERLMGNTHATKATRSTDPK